LTAGAAAATGAADRSAGAIVDPQQLLAASDQDQSQSQPEDGAGGCSGPHHRSTREDGPALDDEDVK